MKNREWISTIMSTTIRTIENLNKYKAWWDALILYFKYRYHSERQETNQPRANNSFMMKWLWRWKDRLQTARAILFKEWLIEEIQEQDEKWKFEKRYVKVNYITRLPGSPSDGEPATNALSVNNINALSVIKENACPRDEKKEDDNAKTNDGSTITNENSIAAQVNLLVENGRMPEKYMPYLEDFIICWSEPNKKWVERWKLEDTRSMLWRLATWKRNADTNFWRVKIHSKQSPPQTDDERIALYRKMWSLKFVEEFWRPKQERIVSKLSLKSAGR